MSAKKRQPPKKRLKLGEYGPDNDTLQSLLHEGGVSKSALARMLNKLEGVASLTRIKAEDKKLFEKVRHVEACPRIDGGVFNWEFCNPGLQMVLLIEGRPKLRRLYERAVATRGSSEPWTLIVAFDEYVPGNKFALDSNRKSMNLSFNFAELGPHALASDATWFMAASTMSQAIGEVRGGWSAMLRRFLNLALFSDASGLATAGVAITFESGEVHLLKARLGALLTDGDGFRLALQWRGAGSLKPCFRHCNVLKKDPAFGKPEGFEELDSCNFAAFRLVDQDELVTDVASIIEATRMRAEDPRSFAKGRLDQMCYITGLNVSVEGLLADARLHSHVDWAKVVYIDWVHTALQEGVLNVALTLFTQSCEEKLGIGWDRWEACLKHGWCFPDYGSKKAKSLHRVFSQYRMSSDTSKDSYGKVRGNMSEMLGVYGLIRHVAETVIVDEQIALEKEAFLAACSVVDVMLDAKRGITTLRVAAQRLRDAAVHALTTLFAAHGREHAKPKHHWLFDIAELMEIHQAMELLLDAFVVERNHLHAKDCAQHVRNTRCFERSAMQSILTDQWNRLGDLEVGSGLRGPSAELDDGARIAKKAIIVGGWTVTVGDVVQNGGAVGQVVACVEDGGNIQLLIDELEDVRPLSRHSCRASRRVARRSLWQVERTKQALAWYSSEDTELGMVVVRS